MSKTSRNAWTEELLISMKKLMESAETPLTAQAIADALAPDGGFPAAKDVKAKLAATKRQKQDLGDPIPGWMVLAKPKPRAAEIFS